MARHGGKDRGVVEKPTGSGQWWVRLYANGKEKWFRCDTKSQAKALYGRLKGEQREGTYFPEKFAKSKDITLSAWILRCLEGSANRGTVNERRYARRWRLLLGKRLLSAITVEELRRIQAIMKARRSKLQARYGKEPRAWAPGTINRHFGYLRHVLNLAIKDRLLDRNPVSGVKFLTEATTTRFLTDIELESLRGIMTSDHWRLVVFSIETGLRREEQFNLRWNQVDMENGILTIPLPKGGRTRHVPLSEGAKAILRALQSFLESGWVFPSLTTPGKPLDSRNYMRRVYKPALRKAGIVGACWHTLRHTAASRRIMSGVDLVSVKSLLGHRNIETTMRYSHLSPNHLQQAVNRGSLSDHLRSSSPTTPPITPVPCLEDDIYQSDFQDGTGSKTGSRAEGQRGEGSQPIDYLVRPAGIEPATLSLED
jgi:integrase